MSDASAVLIAGNCHAAYLGRLLVSNTDLKVALVRTRSFPFMRGLPPNRVTYLRGEGSEAAAAYVQSVRDSGGRVVLVEQYTPRHSSITSSLADLFKPEDRSFFIHAEVKAYFPATFLGNDWKRALKTRTIPVRKIRRRFDIDVAAIEASLERAGLDPSAAQKVLQGHRQTSLFHTANHPSAALFTTLFEPCLAWLQHTGALSPQHHAGILAQIEREDGINHQTSHPTHPAVADALELEWANVAWYANWMAGHEHIRERHFDQACGALYEAVCDHRCSGHVWFSLGKALDLIGEGAQAHQAYSVAFRAHPDNAGYCKAWLCSAPGADHDQLHAVSDAIKTGMRAWHRDFEAEGPPV